MSTIYYTADLHIGHRFVSDLRGFGATVDHDAAMIETWWSTILPDDIVYVLGDVALGRLDDALSTMAALPGRKRLIMGNHDRCHPMFRDAPKWHAKYAAVFEYISPFARRRIEGQSALMSHFPYHGDRGEPRYMQYRLPDMGEYLLHGHTHSPKRGTGREIHVGWDAWSRPVAEHEIAEHIAHGKDEE